uniref:Uncharacterized protein n=1 Tax=Setaria digitata TaxID=48799 RepID=A0A915PL54_9BILA
MESDSIVWIKEEVPVSIYPLSELPDSATAFTSSLSQLDSFEQDQDKDTTGEDASSQIIVQFFNGKNENVSAQFNENEEENGSFVLNKEFDITEYEKKLYSNAKQAMGLIDDLCNRSEQITGQQKETLLRLEEEQQEWRKIAEKMEEITKQNEQLAAAKKELEQRIAEQSAQQEGSGEGIRPQKMLPQLEWQRVDSSYIGNSDLSQPNSATFLRSTDKIVVTDQDNGLLLFSTESGLIRKVASSGWKWPQSAVYTPDDKILISAIVKEQSGNKIVWKRNLIKFDDNLELVSRIEGPKWIENETIAREHLCIAPNGYIYLCVTADTFSALYELTIDGQWTELCHKRSARFSNIQILAVIGPITELLLVEQRRGYIWLLSIRESTICARNMIAAVEKPGAMCIDDQNQLFIHDISQSKIRLLETHVFEPLQDVALTFKNLTAITAYQGLLVAVYCADKIIQIHSSYYIP